MDKSAVEPEGRWEERRGIMLATQTILRLARALHMNYCHPSYCGCDGDENGVYSRLLFTPAPGGGEVPEWLPDWANGSDPEDLYLWAQQEAHRNPEVAAVLKAQGLRVFSSFSQTRQGLAKENTQAGGPRAEIR